MPDMFTIQRIDHLVLRTVQPQLLIHFYQHILHCTLERENDDIGLYQLRAGDALIDIVDVAKPLGQQGGAAPSTTENNLDHFCLQIAADDLSLVYQYLLENNVKAEPPQRRYGAQGFGDSVYLWDPDGNQVELRLTHN